MLHKIIYRNCGNVRLIKIIEDLWTSFPKDTFWVISCRAEKSAEEHEEIIKAIEEKDGTLVEKIIIKHINSSKKDILSFISSKT